MKKCQAGHVMEKKFLRGQPYFFCSQCNKKDGLPFSYRLGDRPSLKEAFRKILRNLPPRVLLFLIVWM